MRRVVIIGFVLAIVAVAYAATGRQLALGGLLAGWFQPSQRLPALRTSQMPFSYPAHLWRDGVEGEVLVRIHITTAGGVDSVVLGHSSGNPQLDEIALTGARKLTYHPALQGDQAVAVWAVLPVRFQRHSVTAGAEVSRR